MRRLFLSVAVFCVFTGLPGMAWAACSDLPAHEALRTALQTARAQPNGGLDLDLWATLVDRGGVVCAVAFSGADYGAQWPASRVISAQKAYTANGFSVNRLALSTANLYAAVQPGGSLFGLQHSNPVNAESAYQWPPGNFGSDNDPMENIIIGGINVFGGGLALYNAAGQVIGGLGVSGDTSCADHNVAWRVRNALVLDHVTGGVTASGNDQIIYDIVDGVSASGFGHPGCSGGENAILPQLPATRAPAVSP